MGEDGSEVKSRGPISMGREGKRKVREEPAVHKIVPASLKQGRSRDRDVPAYISAESAITYQQ